MPQVLLFKFILQAQSTETHQNVCLILKFGIFWSWAFEQNTRGGENLVITHQRAGKVQSHVSPELLDRSVLTLRALPWENRHRVLVAHGTQQWKRTSSKGV